MTTGTSALAGVHAVRAVCVVRAVRGCGGPRDSLCESPTCAKRRIPLPTSMENAPPFRDSLLSQTNAAVVWLLTLMKSEMGVESSWLSSSRRRSMSTVIAP